MCIYGRIGVRDGESGFTEEVTILVLHLEDYWDFLGGKGMLS